MLQLLRDPNCFQPLLLLRLKEVHEFREKILLCLCNLLLQRVDLDYQYPHSGRAAARIEQCVQLLHPLMPWNSGTTAACRA